MVAALAGSRSGHVFHLLMEERRTNIGHACLEDRHSKLSHPQLDRLYLAICGWPAFMCDIGVGAVVANV